MMIQFMSGTRVKLKNKQEKKRIIPQQINFLFIFSETILDILKEPNSHRSNQFCSNGASTQISVIQPYFIHKGIFNHLLSASFRSFKVAIQIKAFKILRRKFNIFLRKMKIQVSKSVIFFKFAYFFEFRVCLTLLVSFKVSGIEKDSIYLMDNQEEAMIQSNSDGQEHSLNQKQSFSYQQIREGAWDQDQIRRFMVFSHFNRQIMLSRLLRRTLMIFKQMALFIYSRNPTQCRSQFQKVIKKHKSINRVLKKYQQQIGQELFQELCLSFSKNPLVKYVNQTPPPKQTAGHAISRYTQTDFPSDSESSEDNKLLQKQQAID